MISWFKTMRSLSALLLGLALLAYAVGFSYLTIVRYEAFESRALDMGNLDQAIWNTAHGNWFHLTNQPGTVNRLSLHVEPIIIPISWLYWLAPGPPMLLILQATVVALGAWPLFALAWRELDNEWLALIFGLLWLLNPTLQAANWYEFHPLTLAPTFLVAAFYCFVTRRSAWFALFAILAASCKEEVALLIFMLGGYAFVVLRQRRLGLLTMILSLAWALIAVLVIQNTFAAGNIHWGRYTYLGESPVQMVGTLLTRPGVVLTQLRAAGALNYVALLLLPVGFSALLAPEILILALPSIAINLLADYPPMHQVTELIYAVAIAPFVLIAAVYGVKRMAMFLGARLLRANTQYRALLLALLVGGSALFAQWRFGYLSGAGNYRLYTITEHHRRAAAIFAQIPPAAKVSAQDRLDPHVSGRETIYIFPRIDDADTVLLDVTGPPWPLHPKDIRRTVDDLLADDFGVAAAEDGYLLLRKGEPRKVLPPSFFQAWQIAQPLASRRAIDFADTLRLLDYRVITDSHGEMVTQFDWQLLKPIAQNLRFYVGYLDSAGNVLQDTNFYPPVVELWYPTAQWAVEQPVRMQTLPWTLAAPRFTLVLGLYAGDDWQQTDQRLPVSSASPDLAVLENQTLVRLGGYVRQADGEWVAEPLIAAPTSDHPARFGDALILNGWQIEPQQASPGAMLTIQLGWQAESTPDFDYTLFIHLLDQQGEKIAQVDDQPRDAWGPRPMTSWRAGQVIVDEHSLAIPADLPAGDYTLILGLYNWQTGDRLPVTGVVARPDETVHLLDVRVK